MVQQDSCSYKKRQCGHRETPEMCTQRDNPVRTQGEDGCLHTKDSGLRRNQPADTMMSHPAYRTETINAAV